MNVINLKNLETSDIDEIVSAFTAIGWNKPRCIYENYLAEQVSGDRLISIAKINNKFSGYITIKWKSAYPNFNKLNIPEIVDLNVLPSYRKHGVGTKLVKYCERIAMEKGYSSIGIGFGLTADYGNAQRLYIQLGYMPDGNGLHYKNVRVQHNETVVADDDLVLYLTKKL